VRWDAVEQAIVAALSADDELLAILGGARIYPASASRKVEIPSIEYFMVADIERESLESVVIQIDYWARGRAQAAQIERRIRHLLHADTRRTLGGIEMATLYLDSRDHDHPEPGVVHRSLDFRFEPVRERYTTS